MLENDLLIKHLRAMAEVCLAACAQGTPGERAAQFVFENFGRLGQITEAGQRTDRQPEATDTLAHADPDRAMDSTEISDKTYLPHFGVYAFSHHTTNDWANKARKLGLTYSFKKDTSNMAIEEEEILKMAEVIQERRRLSEATKRIKAGEPMGEKHTAKHPGTDARDSTKDSLHSPYKNWSDVERSQSSICLTISNGSRYVNGSMSQHQSWVSIDIKNPDGRTLVEVAMSPEQFASFLIGRTMVPCTLDHYWSQGHGSIAMRERVYNPEPILKRMQQRLRDSTSKQDKDFTEVIETLVAQAATGKPLSKSKLEELIKSLERVKHRRAENAGFIIEQAVEEGSALAETAMLRVLLSQTSGLSTKDAVLGIAKSFRTDLIEQKP